MINESSLRNLNPLISDASNPSIYKRNTYNQGSMKKQIEEYITGLFGDTSRLLPDRTLSFDHQMIKAPGGWQRETKANFSPPAMNPTSCFVSQSERKGILPAVNPTALETPGPGHYKNTRVSQHPNDMVQQVIEFAKSSRVHFGSFSKRETDQFLKRDPNHSPFKNATKNESPAPG